MYSVYRLRADELDERFLKALQMLFTDKVIEIRVSEVNNGVANGIANGVEHQVDETAYLLQSAANRKHLLEAVEYIDSGKPLIIARFDDLDNDVDGIAHTLESDPTQ